MIPNFRANGLFQVHKMSKETAAECGAWPTKQL